MTRTDEALAAMMGGEGLKVELYQGVPHFKSGQHVAWSDEDQPDGSILLYADTVGRAVFVLCERSEDSWSAVLMMSVTYGGLTHGWEDPPDGHKFSEAALKALDSPHAFQ